ncbi:ABC-2 type transport system permease protein [Kibdelosporangium banguiense]|uniref:ABC-2 type transport system permease protein n=1 Tax=Kibdelosporangium banguiense TaxID=1365924 RepID=A0ABS4T733_9PSEU|nr:ABC transporter permease [Kibdelosporangium banguiense]MBP2320188.1 ABC-2 type transport system permease protein [Kibdelosporangium banguiense]
MSGGGTLTFTELKLFLRDPASTIATVALPVAIVVVFGVIAQPAGDADPIMTYFPTMALALGLAQLALNLTPTTLAGYREKGILRRMSTTPVHPAKMLTAQLAISVGLAVVAAVLVTLVGHLGFQFELPQHVPGFLAAFGLGCAALFSMGLLVAAVAPSARVATGVGVGLFFVSLVFGGVFMPAETLPPFLVRIGDFTPLGATMQSLRDSWGGTMPEPLHLAVLGGYTIVAGLAAAKLFRWE